MHKHQAPRWPIVISVYLSSFGRDYRYYHWPLSADGYVNININAKQQSTLSRKFKCNIILMVFYYVNLEYYGMSLAYSVRIMMSQIINSVLLLE